METTPSEPVEPVEEHLVLPISDPEALKEVVARMPSYMDPTKYMVDVRGPGGFIDMRAMALPNPRRSPRTRSRKPSADDEISYLT